MTLLALLLGSSSLLWTSCGSTGGHAAGGSSRGPAPIASETVTQGEAEQALFTALNAARHKAGKPALRHSSQLAAMARGETATAAAAGSALPGDNTNAVRDHSDFPAVGKLLGQLTDRGPRTGASFVDYWVKQNHEMLEDDWSAAGVGISRTPKGQLLAVVFFGGTGDVGSSLMQPVR